jgi:flagellar protein FliO/FliZ
MFASPQAAATAHATGLGGLGSVTLALLAVLAAIFALAWLLRRVRAFSGGRVDHALEVLANVPLGPKERAVLLRVGDAQLLLGVAPGRVSMLHLLASPLEPAGPAAGGAPGGGGISFRALLARSLGK